MPDIGRSVTTLMRFTGRPGHVVEDVKFNIESLIQKQLEDISCKVNNISYDPAANANRIGFQYEDTKGSGVIELFVNSRKMITSGGESRGLYSLVQQRQSSVRRRKDLITQKGGLQQAASQLFCDYAIEYNLQANASGQEMLGTFRVFSYLQPQDSLFFQSPDFPVAMFQYKLAMKRLTA